MIIFDELSYAKEIENEKIESSYNCIKKGIILAKYYMSIGKSEEEILRLLNKKFSILDCSYNYNVKYLKIKKMIEQAKQNPELIQKSIEFSNDELEFIRNIKNINIEKVVFILLCLTKFYNYAPIYFSVKEVFDLAKVNANGLQRNKIMGYIISNKFYSLDERKVNGIGARKIFYFINEGIKNLQGDPVLQISDYRNLVYYYLRYIEEDKFILCSQCGCLDFKNSNSQLYCKKCAKEVANKQRLVSKNNLQ